MRLVAEVVGMEGTSALLDGAIYLMDPVDPSSIFPEALALKRQCDSRQAFSFHRRFHARLDRDGAHSRRPGT
jgi:hypothetical protein